MRTNDKILKEGPTTNIFKKAWENIIHYNIWEKEWFKGVLAFLVIVLFFSGIVGAFIYKDNKLYPHGDYELVYKVYYTPNHVKEYTMKHNRPIEVKSSDGTNYIYKKGEGRVLETNAPIEIISYKRYK